MALVRSQWRSRTASSPKKRQKVPSYKQNIALFLYSSTMMVAPYLHLNFRTKVEIFHSIETKDFFFREHYGFETKIDLN